MFGFLKNLLRRPPAQQVETQEPSYEQPASAAWSPSPPSPPPARFAPPQARKNPIAQAQTPQAPQGKGVEVSLQKTLATLPLELQPRVLMPNVGEMAILIPLEKILDQLSTGSVKISFGELRRAAPGVFSQQPDRDRTMVTLPLQDVLARLDPALITRRRTQRQVEVPEEVPSPMAMRSGVSSPRASGCSIEPPLSRSKNSTRSI